jgi:hypothetical protein
MDAPTESSGYCTSVKAVDEYMQYVMFLNRPAQDIPAGIMFRTAKDAGEKRMKSIKCPQCGKFFTSVELTTKVSIYVRPRTENQHFHEIRSCRICHTEVGVIFG